MDDNTKSKRTLLAIPQNIRSPYQNTEKVSPFQHRDILFNPYQYKPFFQLLRQEEDGYYKWNGTHNLLINDEVGVGKTIETGIILKQLLECRRNALQNGRKNNFSILVVCPNKLCQQWKNELFDLFGIHLSTNYKKDVKNVILPFSYFIPRDSGTTVGIEEENALENNVLINEIQIEESRQEKLKEKLKYLKYDILIVDEAHYLRNKNSFWHGVQTLIALNEPSQNNENLQSKPRIFLTATPIYNKETDLQHIFQLLQRNITEEVEDSVIENNSIVTTHTAQRKATCHHLQLKIIKHEITLSEKEQKINDDLCATYFSEEKNEHRYVFGNRTGFLRRIAASSLYALEKQVEKQVKSPSFSPEEMKEAEESSSLLVDDLEKEVDDPTHFQKGITNLQDSFKDWDHINDSKLNYLIGLIERIQKNKVENQSNGIIIFSYFHSTCEHLENSLKCKFQGGKVFLFTGQTQKSNNFLYVLKEFKKTVLEQSENSNEPIILICSSVANEGQNFQFCQHLIHYDLPFTPAVLSQRNGRIFRTGQKGTPNIHYLTVNKSYDTQLFLFIILNKIKIIQKYAEEGRVLPLDVLPQKICTSPEEFLPSAENNNTNEEYQGICDAIFNHIQETLQKQNLYVFGSMEDFENGKEQRYEIIKGYFTKFCRKFEIEEADNTNQINKDLDLILDDKFSDLQNLVPAEGNLKLAEYVNLLVKKYIEKKLKDAQTMENQENIEEYCKEMQGVMLSFFGEEIKEQIQIYLQTCPTDKEKLQALQAIFTEACRKNNIIEPKFPEIFL
ncbi:MAG: DEAD/DEAH box helicase [Eubacteriales bacterium]